MERYRITDEAAVYFVTYSVVDWLPIFVTQTTLNLICESLRFCHAAKHLRINAFVLMPTHMHAIVFDADGDVGRLNQTLIDFRKFTGRRLTEWILAHGPVCHAAALSAHATADRSHRLWQPSRHPIALQTESFWRQKLDYLHENPCRKGLVRRAIDWRFSSAGWVITDGSLPTDVPLSRIDWS